MVLMDSAGCHRWNLRENTKSTTLSTVDYGLTLFLYGVLLYNDNSIKVWRSGI